MKIILHVEIRKSAPYEYIEGSPRQKRFDPPANPQRIVLIHYTARAQAAQAQKVAK